MTLAKIGYGTQLKMGDGASPEVFTPIAEVHNFGGPGKSQEAVDATHTDSPSRTKEKIAGMAEEGDITIDINWVPSDATQDNTDGLRSKIGSATPTNFEMVFPDAEQAAFAGIITDMSPAQPIEDRMTASVTITPTGVITWT